MRPDWFKQHRDLLAAQAAFVQRILSWQRIDHPFPNPITIQPLGQSNLPNLTRWILIDWLTRTWTNTYSPKSQAHHPTPSENDQKRKLKTWNQQQKLGFAFCFVFSLVENSLLFVWAWQRIVSPSLHQFRLKVDTPNLLLCFHLDLPFKSFRYVFN
jgi:hypothetical protein